MDGVAGLGAGGLVALLGALCYGALARHIPNRAESTCFCRAPCTGARLLGRLDFAGGWICGPAGRAGLRLRAVHVRPGSTALASPRLTGTAIILVAAGTHAVSLTAGARAQAIAVGVELVVITLFTGFGMGQLAHEGLHNVAALVTWQDWAWLW